MRRTSTRPALTARVRAVSPDGSHALIAAPARSSTRTSCQREGVPSIHSLISYHASPSSGIHSHPTIQSHPTIHANPLIHSHPTIRSQPLLHSCPAIPYPLTPPDLFTSCPLHTAHHTKGGRGWERGGGEGGGVPVDARVLPRGVGRCGHAICPVKGGGEVRWGDEVGKRGGELRWDVGTFPGRRQV